MLCDTLSGKEVCKTLLTVVNHTPRISACEGAFDSYSYATARFTHHSSRAFLPVLCTCSSLFACSRMDLIASSEPSVTRIRVVILPEKWGEVYSG